MASNKPQIPIDVPRTGVRADVNSMMRTPEMAARGDNCIFYDGTIRPRPALTTEIGEAIGYIGQYELIHADGGDQIDTGCMTDDGELLLSIGGEFALSLDRGMTWTQPSVAYPAVGAHAPLHMEERNGFLFFITQEEVFRAPVNTLPASLAWTKIATGMATMWNQSVYHYDETNDAWIILGAVTGVLDTEKFPSINVVYTASATASYANFDEPADLENGVLNDNGAWVKDSVVVVRSRNGDDYWMNAIGFSFSGSTYSVNASLGSPTLKLRSTDYDPLGISDFSDIGKGPIDSPSGPGVSFTAEASSGLSHVCMMDVDGDGFIGSGYTSRLKVDLGDSANIKGHSTSAKRMIYLMGESGTVDTMPIALVSADAGMNWMVFDTGQTLAYSGHTWFVMSNNANDYHFAFFYDNSSPPPGDAWRIPVGGSLLSGTSSMLGDLTTMTQLNLSDEDNVIISGGTKAIARLDTTDNEWVRITANQDEDSGSDPWNQNNDDVPPLSVAPDDAGYVSGTTIDGAYGENPWVFRSVEQQGESFLIGTNGQCYPICYHPDMVDGFARRMGEIPPGDPNDIDPWDSDSWPTGYLQTGNLAPKARCLAIGANRVLLGNMVDGSPYGIEVSGFNDTDRGWGLEQFTLLGDTPGSIISMQEISALSIAIYKEDAIYHAIAQSEFAGVAAPFRFELSKAGVAGPCSPASVLRNFDGRHIYLARDGGVYMYDSVAPIDGGRNIRRMIQDKINYNELGKVWGMVDTQRKLVWFFFPTEGGLVNQGIVISTDQGYPWPVWPIKLPPGWNFTAGGEAFLGDDITLGDVEPFGSYGDETLSSFSVGEHAMLLGLKDNVWLKQKWDDDGGYTDSGAPIGIDLETGWATPGGVQVYTADELYHIFSSPDPEMELKVRLKAQQIGQRIRRSKWSPLSAGKLRRRTRHRISGMQFAMRMRGGIDRMFNWGGAAMTLRKTSKR